jgi:hypothetical protein
VFIFTKHFPDKTYECFFIEIEMPMMYMDDAAIAATIQIMQAQSTK